MADKIMFLAGVYYGDTNITLGVYDSKEVAYSIGKSVASVDFMLCNYVKPLTVNDTDVQSMMDNVRNIVSELEDDS